MFTGRYSFTQPNRGLMTRLRQQMPKVLIWMALVMPTPGLYAEDAVVQEEGVAKEISLIIAAKQHPFLKQTDFTHRAEDLDALYKLAGRQLLWLGNSRSEKNIADALVLLNHATDDGLNPASYDVDSLQQRVKSALALDEDNHKERALFDTALSLSVLRYLHDLHYGRVNPQTLNYYLKLRQKKVLGLPGLIKEATTQTTVSQLTQKVAPVLKQYQQLKKALAEYRELSGKVVSPHLTVGKSVKPGSNFAQSQELKDFLIAVGDMPAGKVEPNAKPVKVYSKDIVAGVKQFQLRHGMNGDGTLGASTSEAINVPLKDRVTQIELAMERLRWLPEPSTGRSIIVNIPSFQLWAFDALDQFNADIPNMRVVVGKAMETQTPVIMAKMSFIDFMPFWNVPNKITKDEILPALLKNKRYLDKENMELVYKFGNQVKPVPFANDSIEKIKQGVLRVRQRPGKKNALGKVKFMFPNKEDVYLHDTPASSLFSKSRRDFSHGCVRVANPDKLAQFALKDQWSPDTIQKAMNTPKTQRVILKKPIPVLFFYVTALFDKNDKLAFYSDIYGHDATLLTALQNPGDLADDAIFAPPPPPEPLPETIDPDNPVPGTNLTGAPSAPKPVSTGTTPAALPTGEPAKPAAGSSPEAVKTSG